MQEVVLATLTAEHAAKRISVALVDDETMQRINRDFLGHDWPTDVVTFDLEDDGPGVDGEIVVSVDTARREASRRGIDPGAETLFYCVHGVLHLLGWDDSTPQRRSRMLARQREILAAIGHEIPA